VDARINRSGRPDFYALRKQALKIANEKITGPDGKEVTRGEVLLRSWLKSKQPRLQELFALYAWGPVPTKVEVDELSPRTKLVLHFAHEDPNYQPMPATVIQPLRLPEPPEKGRSA
jgi:hypothetical protein